MSALVCDWCSYGLGAHSLGCPRHEAHALTHAEDAVHDTRAEVTRLRAQLAEAREVLRSVEWGGPYGGRSNCPACANDLGNDHAPDCRLARVLEVEG